MSKSNLFLVKIGEKEHLKEMIGEKLYCSPSQKFIQQEKEQHNKGQGDLLEGKMRIKATGGYWEDNDTHIKFPIQPGTIITIGIENVNNMPIFCMTRGTSNECKEYISEREYTIKFPDSYKEEVQKSFEKADSALIICEPRKFIDSLESTIRQKIVSDNIHYFNYDIMDINWMHFLLGVGKFHSDKPYSMTYENRYRHLFCKDISFQEQREYRFVILDDEIEKPKKYDFKFDSAYYLVDLEQLFSGIKIKL